MHLCAYHTSWNKISWSIDEIQYGTVQQKAGVGPESGWPWKLRHGVVKLDSLVLTQVKCIEDLESGEETLWDSVEVICRLSYPWRGTTLYCRQLYFRCQTLVMEVCEVSPSMYYTWMGVTSTDSAGTGEIALTYTSRENKKSAAMSQRRGVLCV